MFWNLGSLPHTLCDDQLHSSWIGVRTLCYIWVSLYILVSMVELLLLLLKQRAGGIVRMVLSYQLSLFMFWVQILLHSTLPSIPPELIKEKVLGQCYWLTFSLSKLLTLCLNHHHHHHYGSELAELSQNHCCCLYFSFSSYPLIAPIPMLCMVALYNFYCKKLIPLPYFIF